LFQKSELITDGVVKKKKSFIVTLKAQFKTFLKGELHDRYHVGF